MYGQMEHALNGMRSRSKSIPMCDAEIYHPVFAVEARKGESRNIRRYVAFVEITAVTYRPFVDMSQRIVR